MPKLFERFSNEMSIIYPFKYDCVSGEFLHMELEEYLRRVIAKKNGKARATGWTIGSLGRLPQIFTDSYLLKAKIQPTLHLLDFYTEQSLRICIPKPFGGVRPLTVSHDDNAYLNGSAPLKEHCSAYYQNTMYYHLTYAHIKKTKGALMLH
jgi:hypothetical protein